MGGELVQAWPPRRWRNCAQYDATSGSTSAAAQFEVWPIPPAGQPYSLRIEGNAPLNPLIEDTDTCVIDATLVVLFAAAEILAHAKERERLAQAPEGEPVSPHADCAAGRAATLDEVACRKTADTWGRSTMARRLTPYLDFIPAYQQIGG